MLHLMSLVLSMYFPVQADWSWSVHPESGFKVLTPVELIHQLVKMPTVGGQVDYHQYHGGSLSDSVSQLALVVDTYFMEDQELSGDEAYYKEFFDATVEGILTSVGGELVYIDYLSQADRNVCVWKASFNGAKGTIRGKLIITGNHYFGLQAFGIAKNNPDEQMHRFLESFQLL